MQSDAKPSAQSKGKARDDSVWQLGWWELHPLVERIRRHVSCPKIYSQLTSVSESPVVWSKSSVILSAHPTKPVILARHFSSSRQFFIPSPSQVNESPSSYEPPSIISLSPNESWLFAYFPGKDQDGVACLWRRMYQLDSWVVRDWWSTPNGSGIVTAEWTGLDREVGLTFYYRLTLTEFPVSVGIEGCWSSISPTSQGINDTHE